MRDEPVPEVYKLSQDEPKTQEATRGDRSKVDVGILLLVPERLAGSGPSLEKPIISSPHPVDINDPDRHFTSLPDAPNDSPTMF